MRTRDIRAILRDAGPFKATSLANGTVLIEPFWSGSRPKGCTEDIPRYDADGSTLHGDCPKCHTPHQGGVFSRMELAAAVADLLNKERGRR